MSWLSSIGNAIGGAVKGIGKGIGKAAGIVGGIAKKVVTPLASFAVGLVPGVGPLLSKGVDIIGNKLLGEEGDPSSDAYASSATPVSDLMSQLDGSTALQLGNSPAGQALANATAMGTANSFLGIGGSAPGIFGIGDGKPGVFGIGDGKPGVFGIGTGTGKTKTTSTTTSTPYTPGVSQTEYVPNSSGSGSSGGIIALALGLLAAAVAL